MSILSDSDAITAVDDDGSFRSSPAPSTAFTPFSPARRSKSTSPDSTTKERQYEESLWRHFPGSRGLKGLEILIPGPGSMGTISRKATTGSGFAKFASARTLLSQGPSHQRASRIP